VIRPVVLIAGASLALAVAGCGGGSGNAGSSGGGSGGSVSTPSPPASTTSSAGASTPNSNFAFGQTVQITAKGIAPKWLISLVGKQVTWQNHTGHAVKVIFDHFPVSSPLIPAGGSWRSKALGAASITYHVTTQPILHGAVQVTPASQ
jgi:hypothetical protein